LQIHYKSGNTSVIRKIEQIFLELSNSRYEGTGNPEPLKYQLAGYWSRRINKKDWRLLPRWCSKYEFIL